MPYSTPTPDSVPTYTLSFLSGNDWDPDYLYASIEFTGGSAGVNPTGAADLFQEIVDFLAAKSGAIVTGQRTQPYVSDVTPTP